MCLSTAAPQRYSPRHISSVSSMPSPSDRPQPQDVRKRPGNSFRRPPAVDIRRSPASRRSRCPSASRRVGKRSADSPSSVRYSVGGNHGRAVRPASRIHARNHHLAHERRARRPVQQHLCCHCVSSALISLASIGMAGKIKAFMAPPGFRHGRSQHQVLVIGKIRAGTECRSTSV